MTHISQRGETEFVPLVSSGACSSQPAPRRRTTVGVSHQAARPLPWCLGVIGHGIGWGKSSASTHFLCCAHTQACNVSAFNRHCVSNTDLAAPQWAGCESPTVAGWRPTAPRGLRPLGAGACQRCCAMPCYPFRRQASNLLGRPGGSRGAGRAAGSRHSEVAVNQHGCLLARPGVRRPSIFSHAHRHAFHRGSLLRSSGGWRRAAAVPASLRRHRR